MVLSIVDPVHVLYDGSQYLYIGSESGNCVWVWDPAQPTVAPAQIVASTSSVPIDATGGIALAPDGNGGQYLYVCSRKGQSINQYQLDTSSHPPVASQATVVESGLGDDPEFAGVLGSGVFN